MSPSDTDELTIEWSLLGFLAECPMHGYEIRQHLTEAAGLGIVWHVKQSQIYALLGRLEERGCITYTLEPQTSRPPRKVYALTKAGEQAFHRWVSTPVEHGRDFRLDFLAKVYFAQRQGPKVLRTLLGAQRKRCETWLAELQATLDQDTLSAYEQLVVRFRIGQIQAMLDWLATSETALASETDTVG